MNSEIWAKILSGRRSPSPKISWGRRWRAWEYHRVRNLSNKLPGNPKDSRNLDKGQLISLTQPKTNKPNKPLPAQRLPSWPVERKGKKNQQFGRRRNRKLSKERACQTAAETGHDPTASGDPIETQARGSLWHESEKEYDRSREKRTTGLITSKEC